VLVPGRGSWFVLGSVLTDAPLVTTDPAPVPDGCGPCRRCHDGCPTAAIVGPGVVDARRCLSWLLQAPGTFPVAHRVALGDRIYGCDECQDTCPPNVRLAARHRPRDASALPVAVGPGEHVDLLELLWASDERLIEMYGRWYLADRDPVWLRRNALVILGNVAPVPIDESVRSVVRHYLGSDVPVLRAHALWAARRLGYDRIPDYLRTDPDPVVRAEWDRSVIAR